MNRLTRVPAADRLYGTRNPPSGLAARLALALRHWDDLTVLGGLSEQLGDSRFDVASSPAELVVLVVADTLADLVAAGYLTGPAAELLLVRLEHNTDRRLP